jgi:glucose-6-phosphate isomerase
VAFTVFGLDVMWYGILLTLGIVAGSAIGYARAETYGIKPKDKLLDILIFAVPVSTICARLYYVIFEWDSYKDNLGQIFNIRGGGLAIHGAIIGALLTVFVCSRVMKFSFRKFCDLMAPGFAAGQAIGRWGNYMNQEAHGTPTDLPWGILIDGEYVHPTFLYESIWCFLILFFLLFVYEKKWRKNAGQEFLLYGILYSVERFFVEGLRTDSLWIGNFRQAQVISVACVIVFIALWFVLNKYPIPYTEEVRKMIQVKLDGIGAVTPDYEKALGALKTLKAGTGAGNDYIGWVALPSGYDRDEFARIKAAAARVREKADCFVVIGIGGSYLGARAAIELLKSPRHNETGKPAVYFLGNGLSGDDVAQVLDLVKGKSLYVNVISKSGTTLEPAVAFRIFKNYLEKTYGKDGAKERILCTTDKARGALKSLADKEGYECFVVPDDIGGRYSVLTAVGLLPMAAAGIDIDRVMKAAADAMAAYTEETADNPAVRYAAARQALYGLGKKVEILSYPGESFRFMAEWWKQLYGESEGKDGLGIFPASCELTADLHSLGQYIQDGERMLLESILRFESTSPVVKVPFDEANGDGLNYVAGKSYDEIFAAAAEGVKQAHIAGGVPVIDLTVPAPSEETFAELVCFYEVACAVSGYMEGVNPFNQPGVEAYKKNMFALLGKK